MSSQSIDAHTKGWIRNYRWTANLRGFTKQMKRKKKSFVFTTRNSRFQKKKSMKLRSTSSTTTTSMVIIEWWLVSPLTIMSWKWVHAQWPLFSSIVMPNCFPFVQCIDNLLLPFDALTPSPDWKTTSMQEPKNKAELGSKKKGCANVPCDQQHKIRSSPILIVLDFKFQYGQWLSTSFPPNFVG